MKKPPKNSAIPMNPFVVYSAHFSGIAIEIPSIRHEGMLAELYVEALLRDELLADYVWDLWVEGRYMTNTRGRCG